MKKFLMVVILMLSMSSFACAADEPVDIESASKLSKSVDEFCWKYFATLDRNENIFYSPYGINSALSILANGASGDTRTELLNALAAENVDFLNNGHKNFLRFVEKNYRGDNVFMESNLLLIDKAFIGRGLDKNFRRVVNDDYKSDVREANFSGDADSEKKKISRWVADKTKNFIPDYQLIVTADTIADLLNVVYFKGNWAIPFDAGKTKQMDFTNRDGSKVKVDMMHAVFNEKIVYRADDKFKGIELPYSANAAMYLILPVDENALDVAELWNNQTIDYRAKFLDGLKNSYPYDGKVIVRLPKFELDIENNLVQNFKAMGIVKSFSDDAEYFNIVKGTSLKIGSAKHRAKVKVDEQGTKAAAVTEISMLETTAAPGSRTPTAYFYADRPFIFVIRDVETNITLFAGVANHFK